MKAAFFDGEGSMEVRDFPDPVPGIGDAIIDVKSTGICGSDLLMNAEKTAVDEVPAGHEVAGEIIDVGPGVSKDLVGSRVAIETIGHGRSCGECWYCRMGQYRQCLDMAPQEGGGFAEYIKRRASGCYTVSDSMTWSESALVEPLAVSIHGVRRGALSGGQTVAILGSGTIGLTAVVAARQLGAGTIIVTARHKQQADMALALGADYAVSSEGDELRDLLFDKTEGRGSDITIETVGGKKPDTLIQSIDVTRMQGKIVILGGFRNPLTIDWLTPLLKEQSFVFSQCYSIIDGIHDYELAVDMLAHRNTQLGEIVTHKFPLGDIEKGFQTAYNKSTGSIKVQIHQ